MNYSYLFSKNDAISYAILASFNAETSRTISKEAIGTANDLTNYQLNKFFVVINADLMQVSGDQPCYLEEVKTGAWTAFNLETTTLQKIALLYLNRSSLYTALVYRFFYDNLYTKREYIVANYMSSSAFYRSLDQLEVVLKKNHFYTSSTLFKDKEFTIRLHLFQLYYTMYNTLTPPFESLNDLISNLINTIQPHLPTDLRPTEVTKLATFLRIWILRLFNHHEIKKHLFKEIEPDQIGEQLYDLLAQQLAPEIKLSRNEFNYLYMFLITQGYLGEQVQTTTAKAFPTVVTLSNQFMRSILSENVLVNTQLINGDALWQQLLCIHLQLTSFYIEPTTFIRPKQMHFFADLYPAFDLTVNRMLVTLQRQSTFHLTKNMAVNLYFSYMFALVNAIPPELMRDQVHICVDFSQGALYTNYVIESLNSFSHAHIVIDRQLREETDIYISDFQSPEIVQPQIIWQDPPTSSDWSHLADVILQTKHNKLHELFPDHKPLMKDGGSHEES
ncbi:hypothetical protein FD04_GL001727 [Secundilactobacillus odoratitofui DSM 19909 = JCM 15043]|uniref:Mga helix-turn-helix domain-containing protein n=1 Tax=Secundilactobacillus odoratitofui DSM 19909 = JCM 15043 TaxID=1423776 RepID=A0A0R1LXR7_9LACO|nr:hypothetical protein [Secundilactobacillus odoratitofui]KRK97689.1 hypothetical protein FD04_GL001727 [Secundilactobacillus odoratitofui DSM 19909 = JCM 15043]